ncbi:hypothetical protein D7I47_11415 [Protaetiibacter intestinalis]|uniref:Alternate-type signal peptide domain-containing protein n=1 Tax=Protaetiibacter intestinalis TaxID=2419774 RepID=A0A387BAR4_9MICO|nr:hypothetical protein D7I47_11415 [Protaetiibacter intestinalis]
MLGIGAAATSAAWVDDVFFGATATASSFDLQGAPLGAAANCAAVAEGAWEDIAGGTETTSTDYVDITTTALGAIAPDETYTVPFCLRNAGTIGGDIVVTEVTVSGDLVDEGYLADADADATLASPTIGASNATVQGTLTIETPDTWDDGAFGLDATIVIQVTGTSD